MIKKENRLSGSRNVGRVLQKGYSIKTLNLSCRIISSNPAEPVKLTVVVSKKVASRSVDRNLIKRRVREAFDAIIAQKHGLSMVVFPRMSAKELEFEKLKEEALKCFAKAPSS